MCSEIIRDALERFSDRKYQSNLVFSLAMQSRIMKKRIVYTPFARFSCQQPESITGMLHTQSNESFRENWGDVLEKGDPYFSPNLILHENDIALDFTRSAFQITE